jgi:radical SAM superfamily enzyme YgiQ (UPF0313 family)
MLLINPGVDKVSQPAMVRKFTYACFPTALGFLAAYLRQKNNDDVRILDEQITEITPSVLEREMAALSHPRIVGITNLTITTRRVIQLTEEIKKLDPGITVILGGIHPTVLPEQMLARSSADIVVRKEGEITLSELYDHIKNGTDYTATKGISYRKDGKIFNNPDRELIKNIDDIPPFPYEMFENNIGKYRDFGTIVSSRGCPFDCIFCSQRAISGKGYRFSSVERIVGDIKKLVDRYGQKKIWFIEDSLTIHKQRLYDLLDGIMASGYHKKVAFIGVSRGKDLTYEMLERMKACNFVSLAFGVETGSDRLMEVIDKKELVEDNVRAIKMCREVGIMSDASLIFGLPTETRKDRYDTLKLMCKLPLDGVRFNIAVPFPGTRLYKMAEAEGRLHIHKDWTNCSNQNYMEGNDLPYVPVGTTGAELVFDTMYANLAFYLRPSVLYRTLFKSPLSGGGVLSLPKRWYVKPDVLMSLAQFFYMVFSRLVTVSIRAFWYGITKKEEVRTNKIEI